jgi:hypothetical protein
MRAQAEAAAGGGGPSPVLSALAAHLAALQAPAAAARLEGAEVADALRAAADAVEELPDQVGGAPQAPCPPGGGPSPPGGLSHRKRQALSTLRGSCRPTLQDVLNLLAVCTLLAAGGDGGAERANGAGAVAGAAAGGLRAALDEAWRRPGALAAMDGNQLASLCVVLQRVVRGVGVLPPQALVLAVWQRVAALARRQLRAAAAERLQQAAAQEAAPPPEQEQQQEQQQEQEQGQQASGRGISPQQLAVCLFCLAAYPGMPPPRLLGPALAAAAMGVPKLDAAGLWRLAAAGCAWEPQVRGRPPQQAAALAAALARAVAAHCAELEGAALAAAAQLCVCWLPPGAPELAELAAAATQRAEQQQQATAAAANGNGAAAGAEAARALGWLTAAAGAQGDAALRRLAAALLPPGPRGAAAAVEFFSAAAAVAEARGSSSGDADAAALDAANKASAAALDAALAQLVDSQQLGGSASSGPQTLGAAAAALAGCARAGHWPERATGVADALAAASAAGALPAPAACAAAAALCTAAPPGWAGRAGALQAACLAPQQLSGVGTQELVDLAVASGDAPALREAAFGALAARGAEAPLRAARLPELLAAAVQEGRRVAAAAAGAGAAAAPAAPQGAWVGAARAALGALQHGARFLPPHELLVLLDALAALGLAPEGMLTAAGLQVAGGVQAMAPAQLVAAAAAFERLGFAPPRAPGQIAAEAARLAAAGRMAGDDAMAVLTSVARLRTGGQAARRLLNLVAGSLLRGEDVPIGGAEGGASGGGGGGGDGSSAEAEAAGAQEEEQQQLQQEQPARALATFALAPLASLARVVWAGAALGAAPARLPELLLEITVHPERPSAQTLSSVVWACARLRVKRPDGVVAWAVRGAGDAWGDAPAHALANLAWGLWKLGEWRACAGPLGAGPRCRNQQTHPAALMPPPPLAPDATAAACSRPLPINPQGTRRPRSSSQASCPRSAACGATSRPPSSASCCSCYQNGARACRHRSCAPRLARCATARAASTAPRSARSLRR